MVQFTLLEEPFWHGVAIFMRVGAATALMPGFGETVLPARIKLMVGLAFTAILFPMVPVATDTTSPIIWFILTETVIGLLFGLGLRAFVFALQTAGSIAANVTSLAQMFSGTAGQQQPIISNILYLAGIALVFVTGLHITFAEYMLSSYDIFEAGAFPPPRDTGKWGIEQLSNSFTLAFQLAAPFVLLSMLYNITIGAINRAMPQLMVALVGAPFITFASVALLAFSAPYLLAIWVSALTRFILAPF